MKEFDGLPDAAGRDGLLTRTATAGDVPLEEAEAILRLLAGAVADAAVVGGRVTI